jgi:prophage regulatory protein
MNATSTVKENKKNPSSAVVVKQMSIDAAAATPRDRFLRQSDVLEKIGFGESMLNEMIASGSFPKPARIGARAVRWSENEVDAWIAARLAERNGTSPAE